jgi:hypothetical protein
MKLVAVLLFCLVCCFSFASAKKVATDATAPPPDNYLCPRTLKKTMVLMVTIFY